MMMTLSEETDDRENDGSNYHTTATVKHSASIARLHLLLLSQSSSSQETASFEAATLIKRDVAVSLWQ